MTSGRDGSFGGRLRQLREAAGLTQEELAERAGLAPVAISSLERGVRRRPHPHTVRSLADALGLSETERASLIAAVPTRDQAPRPGTPAEPARRSTAPIPPTALVGRERELRELGDLLRVGARLVTLTGPGGVGKTRLALGAATAMADAFPDGVEFVALAPIADAALVAPTVSRTLGQTDVTGRSELEAVREHLREKHLLLVLDNFEHVLGAVPEVAELLASCPHLAVLATSRAPLRVRGEREYPVGPLPVPEMGCVPGPRDLEGNPAVELFVERARDVAPEFGITRSNAAAVASICRRLDGLPLALELVAARLRLLDPTAMLARLDRALPLLSIGARDLPERQRTMEATIRWSYDLLSQPEARLFRRLSAFAGGWDLPAAEAVGAGGGILVENVLDLLSGLVEQSLVVAETRGGGSSRYRLLVPVREYALGRLEESGDAGDVRRRHADYFLEFAERVWAELRRAPSGEWLDRLEAERDDLRLAVSSALSGGRPELAARLAYALWVFFWARGPYTEVLRWMEEALAHGETLTSGGRARGLFVAELMRFRLGGHEGLLSTFEEIVAAFESEGHVGGAADVLMFAGLASVRAGDAERAEAMLEQSRRTFEAIGDGRRAALVLVFLGAIPLNRGDYDRAEGYFQRGLEVARTTGEPGDIYPALYHLALAAQGKGEYSRARGYYAEYLEIGEGLRDKAVVALGIVGLAECSVAMAEPRRAARLYGAADAVLSSIGMPFHPFTVSADFHARYADTARRQLGDDAFDAARAEGRDLGFEQSVAYALERGRPATSATGGGGP